MTAYLWFILIGCLMLARGLAATTLAGLPVTSAIVYLGVGLVLGPAMLGVFAVNPLAQAPLLETMAELAVLISLFSAGVKMPVPVTFARWGASIRLAWLSMAISVALVAGFAYLVLALPIGAAILPGAILTPTDPVLATDVQVRHAGDQDQLRFALTCEAGMNDGSAFPLVMLGLGLLGLHDLGNHGVAWLLRDVLWATGAAIGIGVAGGALLARIGWALRCRDLRHEVLDDLVGLGLIAVVYGACVWLQAWGFLAVYFAGVALRQTELTLAGMPRDRHGLLKSPPSTRAAPAETSLPPSHRATQPPAPTPAPLTVSGESLIFKEHLEYRPVPVPGGAPIERVPGAGRVRGFQPGQGDLRMVWCARHRFRVLPDVFREPWHAGRIGQHADRHHPGHHHAVHRGARGHRQAPAGPLLARPPGSLSTWHIQRQPSCPGQPGQLPQPPSNIARRLLPRHNGCTPP